MGFQFIHLVQTWSHRCGESLLSVLTVPVELYWHEALESSGVKLLPDISIVVTIIHSAMNSMTVSHSSMFCFSWSILIIIITMKNDKYLIPFSPVFFQLKTQTIQCLSQDYILIHISWHALSSSKSPTSAMWKLYLISQKLRKANFLLCAIKDHQNLLQMPWVSVKNAESISPALWLSVKRSEPPSKLELECV